MIPFMGSGPDAIKRLAERFDHQRDQLTLPEKAPRLRRTNRSAADLILQFL